MTTALSYARLPPTSNISTAIGPSTRHLTNPSLLLAAIAVSISTSFSVLLPVVPVLVERGGPHGAAGAATAALFIGAVAGELLTPWLMARWSSTRLLIAGQLLTAVPSLVYVIPQAASWQMLAAAWMRGLGMGVAIVVAVVLVAELARAGRRGRSIGYFGLALSAPGVVMPSIGVSLMAIGRTDVDALIAFGIGVAGAAVALKLPRRAAHAGASANLLAAVRQPGLLAVFAGFVLVSSSFGGVITYAPVALPANGLGSAAAFLLIAGAARAVSRWYAGVLGDRHPPRLVLVGGVALALVGLVALAVGGSAPTVAVAAVAYGTGYGAVQTASYLAMTERATSSHWNAISALWNSGIDLGSSLGGTLLGLSAARYGYAAAVWVLPVALLVSLGLLSWPRKSGPAGLKETPVTVEPVAAVRP